MFANRRFIYLASLSAADVISGVPLWPSLAYVACPHLLCLWKIRWRKGVKASKTINRIHVTAVRIQDVAEPQEETRRYMPIVHLDSDDQNTDAVCIHWNYNRECCMQQFTSSSVRECTAISRLKSLYP